MIRYGYNSTSVSSVESMLEERDARLEVLKFHLLKAQAKNETTRGWETAR